MPSIFYGKGAYERTKGNLPPIELVNMWVEPSVASEEGVCLQSRPGLDVVYTLGDGPVTGLYRESNVLGGNLIAVSDGALYDAGSPVASGAIAGTGPVSFAGTAAELLITAGSTLYSYDGTTLSTVTFPDSADVTAVEFHDGLFLAARGDSHKYYWSAVLDGTSWDALDFASAESRPDKLLDLKVINDTLWLFGESTIEPWANTGDADAPYRRIEQRIYSKGLHSTGCVRELDNTLYFVGNDSIVYRLSDVPERVSNHGIEEKIAAATDVTAYTIPREGHKFFVVKTDSETLAYDVATGQWCELQNASGANFQGQCSAHSGTSLVYFGDRTDGKVWRFSSDFDDNGTKFPRVFTAAMPLDVPISINNVRIWTNPGQSSTAQTVSLSYSRDGGQSYEVVGTASMGTTGNYRTLAEWRALGMVDFPGVMFKFTVGGSSAFRLSGVKVNEPGGGRSR